MRWRQGAGGAALVLLCAGCGLSSETTTVGPADTGPVPTTIAYPTITTVPVPPASGRGRASVVVGSYVGQPVAGVKALLAAQHALLPRYVSYPVRQASQRGVVVGQSPPAEATVAPGSTLTLDIGAASP